MSLAMKHKAKRVSTLFLGRRGTVVGTVTSELEDGGGASSSKRGHESSVIEEKPSRVTIAASLAAQAHNAEASCSICQEPIGIFSPDGVLEAWSVLPCGHRFGSHCIKHYLRIVAVDGPVCPVCRQPMYHSCSHPTMPMIEQPPNSKKVQTSTPGPTSEAKLFKMRFTKCNYCTGQAIEQVSRHTTSSITNSATNNRKPRSRMSAALRWVRAFDIVSQRSNRRDLLHRPQTPNPCPATPPSRASPATPPPIDINRVRQESANNGEWQGPWIDPFPRPRDEAWEKWWIAQNPQGA